MEEKDTNNQINRTENTNIDAQTNVNLNLFSYLDKRANEDATSFYFTQNEIKKIDESINVSNNIYTDSGKYKYAICILLKDDEESSSQPLEDTLNGIKNNFGDLSTFLINYEEIIIFVFVNQIINYKFVDKDSIKEYLNNEKKKILLKNTYEN